MLTENEIAYYSRQILVDEIGMEGQLKLSQSKVLVIGAGGLGCPVLQYLVAAGVGNIGIIDGDVVDRSNLHRQLLFTIDSIGKNKAFEALKSLKKRNPFIEIKAFPYSLTSENAIAIIDHYDIVVDCTDNYETRFLVNDATVLLNKPLVYGSIYRFEGQVSVFNYNDGPTYRCLFPEIPKGASVTNCSTSGVIGVLPGIIGLLQANEVLKLILGYGEVLSGKILVFNAQMNSFDLFTLNKNIEIDYSLYLKDDRLTAANYIKVCGSEIRAVNIDIDTLLESASTKEFLILDVRETDEVPYFISEGVINIPLGELGERLNELPTSKKIAVVCKSGMRSLKAIEILQTKANVRELRNLENGINEQFIIKWKNKQSH